MASAKAIQEQLSMPCEVVSTRRGFMVTRDGTPVPAQVHPPSLLTFESRTHALRCAAALDAEDMLEAHRLITEHGQWWQ